MPCSVAAFVDGDCGGRRQKRPQRCGTLSVGDGVMLRAALMYLLFAALASGSV
jgi:hypothetical protein